MKVMIFQPHDDDAVIAVGGVMQKMLNAGWEVVYVYMTDGRHGSNIMTPEETKTTRKRESEMERLGVGVKKFYDMDIEDGKLGKLRGLKLRNLKKHILDVITKENPNIIFVPTATDMHEDHRATHNIITDIIKKRNIDALLVKYITWFLPDFYGKDDDVAERVLLVEISDKEFDKKVSMVRIHESQIKEGRYDETIKCLNRYFGLVFKTYRQNGMDYGEVIGLYNLRKNKTTLEKFQIVLSKFDDITKSYHGRLEEKIAF